MSKGSQKTRTAISPARSENFAEWYQEVIKAADLAEHSVVRGCMVIKPWGYGLWENIQQGFDRMLKGVGVENAYFPLFIPLSFFQKEATHAEGFATEVAVVTHRRLEADSNGQLQPAAPLEEPLVVRPTSEMIIGDSFSKWIQSYRDLPLKVNQWCNVVRMEMRTRLFLRTTEFLWHEGHSAHEGEAEARNHVDNMLTLYENFVKEYLAIPVITGEKTADERFAGAEKTVSIEAMMQDGRALQAGTSHYLGQNFAKASDISFQGRGGEIEHVYTTSWGMSTRIVGAIIMTHSDDDGLRLPPRIAPKHIVILPVVPKEELKDEIYKFAARLKERLNKLTYHNKDIVSFVDERDIRGGEKNWDWIKKGIPVRLELGPKEVSSGTVSLCRRDKAPKDRVSLSIDECEAKICSILDEIQTNYFQQAQNFISRHTHDDIQSLDQLRQLYTRENPDAPAVQGGFARVKWANDGSEKEILKELKLTVRCIPHKQRGNEGVCIFSGKKATEDIIVAKAY